MCGRIALTSTDHLVEEFSLVEAPVDWRPRYNLAPTESIPIVTARAPGERGLSLARWGLIPRWAKDPAIGARMINARAESAADKPAFRDALARRRCIVPADGFYEWRRDGRDRTPFYVRRSDTGPLALAGLWERWRGPDGVWIASCAVLTTDANDLMRPIHHRMPVIVAPGDYDRWLHPEPLPPEATADILTPPPVAGLELYEVSRAVNSVRNDDPACIAPAEPVPPPPGQLSLF